ncbi:GyrI-like domain-containing protein [Candidatus Enterococcus ferrettii]|uniref:AraC effector-binding domain-containing protein n=1 Tax=Candidatus Enterococcus ferrettii TaxID=2815324 RepID=A0ABV0EIP7_9ENTE|nr:GyrI-like domain-containing protein [Enterococcus sp. 665A]MBO1342946.1 AraC family transcriptional regulator [Enterococcus sp. 665A]
MEHRIVELDAFKIVGYKKESTNENQQGMQDCPAHWGEILSTGKQEALLPLINREPFGLIGASFYNIDSNDAKRFDYYISVATTEETPDGLEEIEVPANTWAVFPTTKEASGQTQVEIVSKWGPQSEEYELLNTGYMTGEMASGGPDMEVYGSGNDIEIWVPVKKK